jgi:hypothetical protein
MALKRKPNPTTVKVMGFLWALEAVAVAGIVLARFVFHWI